MARLRLVCLTVLAGAACVAQSVDPLGSLADYRNAVSRRVSSWDKTGGNGDAIRINAGETVLLADIPGAGAIRHIWMTGIGEPNEKFRRYPLRELVIRMYWDGETEPSVESPLGDFFGMGFGRYTSWQSLPITVQQLALNCYFPMPSSRGARITLTNEGSQPTYPYFHVDYEQYPDGTRTDGQARFQAHWRQEITKAVPREVSKNINKTDEENFVFVNAVGRGHFVGLILFVQGLSTGSWGEGRRYVLRRRRAVSALSSRDRSRGLLQQRVRFSARVQLSAYRCVLDGQSRRPPGRTPSTAFTCRTRSVSPNRCAGASNTATPMSAATSTPAWRSRRSRTRPYRLCRTPKSGGRGALGR